MQYKSIRLCYSPRDKLDEDPERDGGGVMLCPGCTSPIGPAGEPDMFPIEP